MATAARTTTPTTPSNDQEMYTHLCGDHSHRVLRLVQARPKLLLLGPQRIQRLEGRAQRARLLADLRGVQARALLEVVRVLRQLRAVRHLARELALQLVDLSRAAHRQRKVLVHGRTCENNKNTTRTTRTTKRGVHTRVAVVADSLTRRQRLELSPYSRIWSISRIYRQGISIRNYWTSTEN
jgi:hypothetical protein